MSVYWLRAVVALLLLAILAVAAVPLIVLLDLTGGGTGFGLCPEGLGACRVGFTSALELATALTVLLFVLIAAVRLLLRTVRRIERRAALEALAASRGTRTPESPDPDRSQVPAR